MANTVQKGQQRWMQTNSQRSAQHTLPASPPPQFLQHLRRLAVGLPKVSLLCVLPCPALSCVYVLPVLLLPPLPPPHSPPPFLHSPVSVSLVDSFSSQPAEAEQCWDEHPKRNEDGKH